MQEKSCQFSPSAYPLMAVHHEMQEKLYSVLEEVKTTGDPEFITQCLQLCQQMLSMPNDVKLEPTNPTRWQEPVLGSPSLVPMVDAHCSENFIYKKRKSSEVSATLPTPLLETSPIPVTKKCKSINLAIGHGDSLKDKEKGQDDTPEESVKAKVSRTIISPYLRAYIQQMNQNKMEVYEKTQHEMVQKNSAYNSLLSMEHISAIGKRDNLRKEIKARFSEQLRKKFTYAHHITFPFTAKKNANSLPRAAVYSDEIKRYEFVIKEIVLNINVNPLLAAQNAIYLYQHHFLYSIYLRRTAGDQLSDIIISRLSKLGFDFKQEEVKRLKIAIKQSYDLVKSRAPFSKIVDKKMMTPVESPIEPRPDDATVATIVLYDNKARKINPKDLFDAPFSTSLKITQNTNFYDARGKLIGVYRVNKIQPEMIEENLRKQLASVTQRQLNRMGAVSAEEAATRKKHDKEHERYAIRSAPFGILGKKLNRIRPTQFSESAFGIEASLAPLLATAEKIYAECAPIEYGKRCQVMEYASAFAINGSRYLLAAEVNFDKQTVIHKDKNKFPIFGLNPLFVIYPSQNKSSPERTRTYEGSYTFFPAVCGLLDSTSQSYFEGIYFDLNEGDILLWDFDNYYHCNTKLVPLNGIEDPNWHRFSIVGFTKGEALHKITPPLVFEDSEDEDSASFGLTESDSSHEDIVESSMELSQSVYAEERAEPIPVVEKMQDIASGESDELDYSGLSIEEDEARWDEEWLSDSVDRGTHAPSVHSVALPPLSPVPQLGPSRTRNVLLNLTFFGAEPVANATNVPTLKGYGRTHS